MVDPDNPGISGVVSLWSKTIAVHVLVRVARVAGRIRSAARRTAWRLFEDLDETFEPGKPREDPRKLALGELMTDAEEIIAELEADKAAGCAQS